MDNANKVPHLAKNGGTQHFAALMDTRLRKVLMFEIVFDLVFIQGKWTSSLLDFERWHASHVHVFELRTSRS